VAKWESRTPVQLSGKECIVCKQSSDAWVAVSITHLLYSHVEESTTTVDVQISSPRTPILSGMVNIKDLELRRNGWNCALSGVSLEIRS
jgi:hypothetical protein